MLTNTKQKEIEHRPVLCRDSDNMDQINDTVEERDAFNKKRNFFNFFAIKKEAHASETRINTGFLIHFYAIGKIYYMLSYSDLTREKLNGIGILLEKGI